MATQRQNMTLRQGLHQRLSPRQVRFGRLLEMTAPEFEEEIQRVVEENPAIEVVEGSEEQKTEGNEDDFHETAEELQRADYSDEDDIPSYRLNINNGVRESDFAEPIDADDNFSADEVLMKQLSEYDMTEREREIAAYVVGNINSNGYLERSAADIADDIAMSSGLSVTEEEVSGVIEKVRTLDPAGICAYDLRDCLLLQLQRMAQDNRVEIAMRMIEGYFSLFAKKHFDKIRASMEISREEFDEALKVILSLNPKPGSALESHGSADKMRHITPDFAVEITPDGLFSVSVCGNAPELQIEQSFRIDQISDAKSREFIKARREEAEEFISLAKERGETLLAIITAIVKMQHEFFVEYDRTKLRPMVLRDVSEATGYDVSVISRATATKYVLTAQGVIALKSLFTEGIGDEGEVSSSAMIELIKEIVEQEDKTEPLSDEEISERLNAQGIAAARRTVAKYRERMGIPVARLRKG